MTSKEGSVSLVDSVSLPQPIRTMVKDITANTLNVTIAFVMVLYSSLRNPGLYTIGGCRIARVLGLRPVDWVYGRLNAVGLCENAVWSILWQSLKDAPRLANPTGRGPVPLFHFYAYWEGVLQLL